MAKDSEIGDPDAAVAPSSETPLEIPAGRTGPLSSRRWEKPGLPVVEQNAPLRPPRRRTKAVKAEPEAASGEETPVKPLARLESRLRQETDAFRFDSLINGVTTGSTDHSEASDPSESRNGLPDEPTQEMPVERAAEREASREMPIWSERETVRVPLAPVVPAAPVVSVPDSPPAFVAEDATRSVAPRTASRRSRMPVVLIGLGVLLVPVAAYLVQTGKAERVPANGSASGTSTAVSNVMAPRQPGLPNPALTPGESTPATALPTDASALASAPPAISPEVREAVLHAYGVPPAEADRQVLTYLIPPSLNGTDSATNVFPVTPWFANLKRRLDRELTEKARRGEVTLSDAQAELTTNWIRAAHRHYVRNYGEKTAEKAQKIEKQLNWK